jgi:uncharacterized MAPEG superfamily protein
MTVAAPELVYTAAVALFTALIWIPIIVDRVLETGLWSTLKNPPRETHPRADWAYRLSAAHRNAVENLVVFAPLAVGVQAIGAGTPLTALACAAYFYARVAHAIVYTLGLPVLRTLAFLVGFACEMALGLRLLGWL